MKTVMLKLKNVAYKLAVVFANTLTTQAISYKD